MNPGTCRSCGAAIWWCKTDHNRNAPLDKKPTKGTILVTRATGPGAEDETIARVVDVYTNHFITCPNRDEHRKPKSATDG